MKKYICFLFLLLFTTNLMAKEYKITISNWPPYEHITKNQEEKGINIKIVRAVAKSLNWKVKFYNRPFSRCLLEVENGQMDAIMSIYKTPERENFLYFPTEHTNFDMAILFTSKDSNLKYDGNLKSLAGLNIAFERNNSYGEEFDNADYIIKEEIPNCRTLVSVIANKRYPVGIHSHYPLIALAKELNSLDKIKTLSPPISKDKLYIAFTKAKGPSYEKLAQDFSEALKNFKTTPEYKEIMQDYEL